MGKWVAGIAAAVIGAVLISWLTGAGGLFNPKRPDVKILSAETRCPPLAPGSSVAAGILTRRAVHASVDVVNEGSAAALQCKVEWTGVPGLPMDMAEAATSSEFGLIPGDRKTVDMRGFTPRTSSGGVDTALAVTCGNARSPPHPVRIYGC